jgi:hypothetical protein
MSPIIEALRRTPDELEALVRELPFDKHGWVPPDWEASPAEQFTALGTVCHLRDIERDGYHVRLRRVIDESMPDLASVDGFALARERQYERDDVMRALADFRAARAKTIEYARGWGPAQLSRKATFAEYKTLSAGGLLHLLHSHDLQHLAGLRWLLARASA